MKKICLTLPGIAILLLTLLSPALPANKPPEKGENLPVLNLPVPKNPTEKSYLGLSGDGFFKIPQIKARVVIVEIYSMYCPYCQKDAPGVNDLCQRIENNPDLKNKVKLIGIGAGNTPFEVETYRKTYRVPNRATPFCWESRWTTSPPSLPGLTRWASYGFLCYRTSGLTEPWRKNTVSSVRTGSRKGPSSSSIKKGPFDTSMSMTSIKDPLSRI